MIQEDNKYLRDKMDNAALSELMPEFNKNDEWAQLSAKLNSKPIAAVGSGSLWLKVAAMLMVLMAVGGYLVLFDVGEP